MHLSKEVSRALTFEGGALLLMRAAWSKKQRKSFGVLLLSKILERHGKGHVTSLVSRQLSRDDSGFHHWRLGFRSWMPRMPRPTANIGRSAADSTPPNSPSRLRLGPGPRAAEQEGP